VLVPKLFTTIQGYDRIQFVQDLIAGVIVGIVALPLAIAFAVASGVTPDRGLYTAIVAGFLISVFGGSRVQIGGPTGAFVVIVYGIVQLHGLDGLLVATMMAGVILICLGLTGLGNAIKFIPHPVVTGFTSGIALIIFSSQVKDLLGLRMAQVPVPFFAKWISFGHNIRSANPQAIAIFLFALAIIIFWPRINRRVPGPFIALIVTTAIARMMHLDVETIGARFGSIPTSLPVPVFPHVTPALVGSLIGPAITIALLGAIESLLSAVVSDGMIGGRHRSNMELVAQGIANIASPLFGGIPATGAIARTATNVKNGGRTPIAGIVHAITLLLITLFFGKWAAFIPFATLAAVLVVVAYHMSEWRSFKGEFTAPKSDLIVMLVTFSLTVAVDLTVAIQVGMVLAAFLFMKRMSEVTNMGIVTREFGDRDDVADDTRAQLAGLPSDIEVFEINGPFFFGAAKTFQLHVEAVLGTPRVLILRMRNVPAIDSTGMHTLAEIVKRGRKQNTLVILSDVHAQPMIALGRTHLLEQIGEDAVYGNLKDALARARSHIAPSAA
jgi:sulfate permease, SulP family